MFTFTKNENHILSLMSFLICMTLILLRNTKYNNILKNIDEQTIFVTFDFHKKRHIFLNIFFDVPHWKHSHTGLGQHFWVNYHFKSMPHYVCLNFGHHLESPAFTALLMNQPTPNVPHLQASDQQQHCWKISRCSSDPSFQISPFNASSRAQRVSLEHSWPAAPLWCPGLC